MKLKNKRLCVLCQILGAILAVVIFSNCYAEPLKATPQKIKYLSKLEIDETRTVEIKGVIQGYSANKVIEQLEALDDGKPILIRIDSPGGEIFSGVRILKAMDEVKSPITCYVSGMAASMAAVIATACPVLFVDKLSMSMFHEYSAGYEGSRKQLKSHMAASEAMWEMLASQTAKNLGISTAEFERRIDGIEWWLSPQEAVRSGFARAIVEKVVVVKKRPPEELVPSIEELIKQIFKSECK